MSPKNSPSPPSASSRSPRQQPRFPGVSPKTYSLSPPAIRPGPGSYGCVREVYHPLSPKAEPTAILYWDSEEDSDDESILAPAAPPAPPSLGLRANSSQQARPVDTNIEREQKYSQDTVQNDIGIESSTADKDFKDASDSAGSQNTSDDSLAADLDNVDRLVVHSSDPDGTYYYFPGSFVDAPKEVKPIGSCAPSPPSVLCAPDSGSAHLLDSEIPMPIATGSGNRREKTRRPLKVDPEPKKYENINILEAHSPSRDLKENTTNLKDSAAPKSTVDSKFQGKNFYVGEDGILRKIPVSPSHVPLPESDGELSDCPINQEEEQEEDVLKFQGPAISDDGSSARILRVSALIDKLKVLDMKSLEYSTAHSRTSDEMLKNRLESIGIIKNAGFNLQKSMELEATYQRDLKYILDMKHEEDCRREDIRRLEKEMEDAIILRKKIEEQQRKLDLENILAREQARIQNEQDALRKSEDEKKALENEQKKAIELKKKAAAEEKAAKAKAAKEKKLKKTEEEAREKAEAEKVAEEKKNPVYGRKTRTTETIAVERVIRNLHAIRVQFDKSPGSEEEVKTRVDILRDLNPTFSQIVKHDRQQVVQVRNILKEQLLKVADTKTDKMVPAYNYFLNPDLTKPSPLVPAVFVWMVNELAKLYHKQVTYESSTQPELADPMGVIVVSTFADSRLMIDEHSFLDIFIARLLKRNPILRGELGPEVQPDDFYRLGWLGAPVEATSGAQFETKEEHKTRIQGLTVGWAVIACRDFGASKLKSPYPMFNLWNIIAFLLNQPFDNLTDSHFEVMGGLLRVGAKKLVAVYGYQAKKLIELAFTDWAEKGVELGFAPAANVSGLQMTFELSDWWDQVPGPPGGGDAGGDTVVMG